MKKTIICFIVALALSGVPMARAQLAFWSYDDTDSESKIPSECDAVFDESRGGVFMPSVTEMAERGEAFLINPDPTERNKAGYCHVCAYPGMHEEACKRTVHLYRLREVR